MIIITYMINSSLRLYHFLKFEALLSIVLLPRDSYLKLSNAEFGHDLNEWSFKNSWRFGHHTEGAVQEIRMTPLVARAERMVRRTVLYHVIQRQTDVRECRILVDCDWLVRDSSKTGVERWQWRRRFRCSSVRVHFQPLRISVVSSKRFLNFSILFYSLASEMKIYLKCFLSSRYLRHFQGFVPPFCAAAASLSPYANCIHVHD